MKHDSLGLTRLSLGRMRRLSLAALLLLCSTWAAAQNKPVLKIATGELAPYATESRADKGIALSIVRRAFELAGYQVEYTFLPWSRSLAEARIGKWDGTAYWGHKPEHDNSFHLSDNVLTEQWVFVYNKSIKFDWRTLQDLRPYRFAMIQDYTYTPEIWAMANAGELKYERLKDDVSALRMLILGRVEVAPMERNVACDLLSRNFSESDGAQLATHPKWMTELFTTHVMLPRTRPESAVRIQDFNAGLKKLRASGEYARLLSQVKCPRGWVTGQGN
ncbi:ABC transporter substrate-binding protein [Massilia sp. W12]|uniref:substrate-binding periplasmic protein n=1 Tax=Massilia sp. W12 TaxID=3126507 RepID=UPI0030CEF6E2